MNKKHYCPKCGNDTFFTVAHVAQTWKVDDEGNWLETVSTDETVAHPHDDNIWTCTKCGADAEIASK